MVRALTTIVGNRDLVWAFLWACALAVGILGALLILAPIGGAE